MTRSQIATTTAVWTDGTHETTLVDAPDHLADLLDVPGLTLYDGLVIAYAQDLIDDDTLGVICRDTDPEGVREVAELINDQTEAMDALMTWYMQEAYQLGDARCQEWHAAMSDALYNQNIFAGEWRPGIEDLTELRDKWIKDLDITVTP